MAKANAITYDRSLRSIDSDGRMKVEVCTISVANICPYLGREIPGGEALGLEPDKVYNLYRDANELMKAAPTFSNLPLLIVHKAVSAEQPEKRLVVGCTGDAFFEAPYLKSSLAVWDAEGIAAVESGAQEQLSCGYRYKAVMIPGSVDGQPYDGRMTEIEGNHVALVEVGRVGPVAMVSDTLPKVVAHMSKYTSLFAALKPLLAPSATQIAFDAAVEKEAKDAAERFGYSAEDWAGMDEEEKAEAKKKAEDKAKDGAGAELGSKEGKENERASKAETKGKAGDRKAKDADRPSAESGAPDPAKDKAMDDKMPITKADLDAAADTVRAQVKAEMTELHTAREAVKGIVGDVALDSAADVYAFALKKLGIDTKGVHPSAFAALLSVAKAKAVPAAPTLATDHGKIVEAFPGLSRFKQA